MAGGSSVRGCNGHNLGSSPSPRERRPFRLSLLQQQQQQQPTTNHNTTTNNNNGGTTRLVIYLVLLYTVGTMTFHSMRLVMTSDNNNVNHALLLLPPRELLDGPTTTTTTTTTRRSSSTTTSSSEKNAADGTTIILTNEPPPATTNEPSPHLDDVEKATRAVLQSFQAAAKVAAAWRRNNNNDTKMTKAAVMPSSNNDDLNVKDVNNNTVGVLSRQPPSFFDALRAEIDAADPVLRCLRYNTTLLMNNHTNTTTTTTTTPPQQQQQQQRRRIFWGSLIADESDELMNIVAAETYGIFAGIVWIESNRTQNFTPRPFRHLHQTVHMTQLFGLDQKTNNNTNNNNDHETNNNHDNNKVLILPYIDEDDTLLELAREHAQRELILTGWRQLGMTENDVGVLSDLDETLTRDFLRAVQTCDFPHFHAEQHHCHYREVKLTAVTRVYEGSPECIVHDRVWFHPDLIVGHCIEGIGHHAAAPRQTDSTVGETFERAKGFGGDCMKFDPTQHADGQYHAWNAADFRRTCGGGMAPLLTMKDHERRQQQLSKTKMAAATTFHNRSLAPFTAFHFHNFFAQFQSTRFKYLTYGHPDLGVMDKPMHNISHDLHMMVHCVKNEPDDVEQRWKRVLGGHAKSDPYWPIYFHDDDYRQRRHERVREMVLEDEAFFAQKKKDDEEKKQRRRLQQSKPKAAKGKLQLPSSPDPSPMEPRQNITSTNIRLDDDALYQPTAVATDRGGTATTTATVMAWATGSNDLRVIQRFVGSLRKTGYAGHILLGVAPHPSKRLVDYLRGRNVTIHEVRWVNCTYISDNATNKADILDRPPHCAHPHADVKLRWARYPLARDWLLACPTCTGPVLFASDASDTLFQRDPFADLTNITGLQVFQEHVDVTTDNWLTQWPIQRCKGVDYPGRPMLNSGMTVGTRAAMLKYLEVMYEEMKVWMGRREQCWFDIERDDQAIHNYLYYSGQLPFATSMAHRTGGIVHVVGHEASHLAEAHFARWKKEKGLERRDAKQIPYDNATNTSWLGQSYNLTDEYGRLTEHDGSISRVVHQFDLFQHMYVSWLDRQPWSTDANVSAVVSSS